MRRAVAATVVAVVALAVGATAARAADAEPFIVQSDLVYRDVDGVALHIDAFVPTTPGRKRPAILFVHGGGWVGGDKAFIEDEARWAAALGFVTFSVQYRFAPEHPYPAAVDDVRAAVRWLRKPAQVAAFRLDPARIGALGSSAGGHLVAMLATKGRGAQTKGSRIRVAVSWSGPLDFTREANSYSAVIGNPAVAMFLQCVHPDPGCTERQAEASPITHVDRTDAPMMVVNTEDEFVPPDQARAMAAALDAAGVPNRLVVLPGDAHAQGYRDTQWPEAVRYLERYLGKPVAPRA